MRIQQYTGLACPDDPLRVATPGDLKYDGFIEPETISQTEAKLTVMAAIASNGEAYGLTADQWVDEITNLHYPEAREMVLTSTLPGVYPAQTDQHRKRVAQLCERIANEYQGDI